LLAVSGMMNKIALGASGWLNVTASAQSFMRRMIRFGGLGPNAGFRLVVSPGGCAGLSTDFSIEQEPRDGDASLSLDGLPLFIPEATFDLLSSVTIDFADSPTQAGLTLFDPKPATCSSESAKPELVQLGDAAR
jgi:iron-sulfur cluster assembly accessory protein